MSESEDQQHVQLARTALTAAAAAATTYAVRKALSHDNGSDMSHQGGEDISAADEGAEDEAADDEYVETGDEGEIDDHGEGARAMPARRQQSVLAAAWEAASDAVLPIIDDAAEAAGKYTAEHSPDLLRERLIPRFIEAFNEGS